jgi:hypothetical protein
MALTRFSFGSAATMMVIGASICAITLGLGALTQRQARA